MPNELAFRKDYIKTAKYFVEPVENSVVDGGADTYNVINYPEPVMFWVELKHIDFDYNAVKFRKAQEPWLKAQVKMGIPSCVVVKCGSGFNAIYKVFDIADIPRIKLRNGFKETPGLVTINASDKGKSLEKLCEFFVIHHSPTGLPTVAV